MIPPFESDTGKLPPGEYAASWEEVATRFGTSLQRQRLLHGIRAALDSLTRAGCRRVWLNGSFVTAKENPDDFDLCWDRVGADAALLDPVLLDLSDGRAAQHGKYGGAIWPADLVVESGNTILTDFQLDYKNDDRPKGIVVIDLARSGERTPQPWLAASHSQLASSALAAAITAAYGLTGSIEIGLLRSWTNDVYALSSHDASFILKVYRAAWRGPADVHWEIELQDWVVEHGAPVASVIPLADGRLFGTLDAPEGMRCFALFQSAPGHKPSPPWSEALYEEYGRSAALLHEASTDFSSSTPRFSHTLEILLDTSLRAIEPWLTDRPDDLGWEPCAAWRRRYVTT